MLRHGATSDDSENEGEEINSSWSEIGLDKRGIRAAHEAADFLKHFPIREVYHSDLNRAAQTAAIIGAKLQVPEIPTWALRPWNMGVLTRQPMTVVEPQVAQYINKPELTMPAGESFRTFYERLAGIFNWLMYKAQQDKEPIAVVTHSRCIDLMRSFLMNGAVGYEKQDSPLPGGIVGLRFHGAKFDWKVIFKGK